MGYLSNRNVNLLNMHGSIMRLADVAIVTFGPIYMYKLGIPLGYVFLLMAGINLFRIPFRLAIIPMMRGLGIKNSLIVGAMFRCITPVFLIGADASLWWLAGYVLYSGFASATYWTSFHCFYTLSGDRVNRGKHFAVGEAAKMVLVALAPYLSGLFIEKQGFTLYFCVTISLAILSVIPLLMSQTIAFEGKWERSDWKDALRSFGCRSRPWQAYVVDGYASFWPFLVMFALGDFSKVGAIFTAGMLTQAGLQLVLGHYIDKGHIWRIYTVSTLLMIVAICAMGFTPLTLVTAGMLEMLIAFAFVGQSAAYITSLYNEAHAAPNVLIQWICSETFLDLGIIFVRVLGAALFFMDVSLNHILLVVLPGIVVFYFAMRGYVMGRSKITKFDTPNVARRLN